MKKYILFFCSVLATAIVLAQPNYPSAPAAAANLVQLEYYIDTDPGPGNGHILTLPGGTDIAAFNFQADLTGVPNGFHRIYLRTRATNGIWSHINYSFFDNYVLPVYPAALAAAPNLEAAEYFIDTDPGFGSGTPISLSALQDISNQQLVINITGLTPATHKLFVRVKDINGKWSLTNLAQFDNTALTPYPSAAPPAPALGEMEYYIDTDPGFGNATPITFTPGMDISNFSADVSLGSITPGAHTFYIRSRQNPWSLSAYVPFLYSSVLPVTWLYVRGEIKDDKGFINWATAQEEETDKFVIEHSTNGQSFATAGELPAAGNSGSEQRYSFIHDGIVKGMNYYRIKQFDNNGKFTYSKTIQLLYRNSLSETLVAPNPVADNLYIIAGSGAAPQKLELFNMSGKLILARQLPINQQVYSVDVTGMHQGTYILKLYDRKGITSHKILKQ